MKELFQALIIISFVLVWILVFHVKSLQDRVEVLEKKAVDIQQQEKNDIKEIKDMLFGRNPFT